MNSKINFRKMQDSDRAEVLAMMRVFYDSPAVLSTPSDRILEKDFDDCTGECPFVTGFIMEKDNHTAGYIMTAMCYSTEYGGLCVWIEDLYIKPEFRHLGAGTMALEFIEKEYPEAVRFKLEVETENEKAVGCYKKNGYGISPYFEMTKERI
ncbi:MAG: GNAT family N-acetyltransferase [Oscillospiraceae bacterium]|nr:GNAT family N-acetyltransferase [Oscillospiraceae bacterium]